jgi:hypothetical protein
MLSRIEREISEIEQAIAIAQAKQESAYLEYAQALARALQQELILSAYRFCTIDYPRKFLDLSVSTRQELQHDIQVMASAMAESARQALADLTLSDRASQESFDALLVKLFADASDAANHLLFRVLSEPTAENTAQICLNPQEFEFKHREVMAHRSELRSLGKQLLQLQDRLAQQHHNKAIAEAELAWRATWSEL